MSKGLTFEFEPGTIKAQIIKAQADKIDELRSLLASGNSDRRFQAAVAAMQALLAPDAEAYPADKLANAAVYYADALLKALDEEKSK